VYGYRGSGSRRRMFGGNGGVKVRGNFVLGSRRDAGRKRTSRWKGTGVKAGEEYLY